MVIKSTDIIVIGGGLHGSSVALHLNRRGMSVRVIDKKFPGRFASGMNAGGVRSLGRHPAEIPLAMAAMEIWKNMDSFIGHNCGFKAVGQLKIAENSSEMLVLKNRLEYLRRLGFDHEELIGGNELRKLIPAVAQHCIGALICRDDGAANPMMTTLAFW